MDNNSKNIAKLMEGLEGAKSILNESLPPEVEAMMNAEQLEQLKKARNATTSKDFKKLLSELEEVNMNMNKSN